MAILAPTLACADPLHLADEMQAMERGGAQMWHVDIMDGHYVPNLCFSFDQAVAIRHCSRLPLDVHLMVDRPADWLAQLAVLAPEYAAFHMDATPFAVRMIGQLKAIGIHPGVVLNPSQPVYLLDEVLPLIDYVLLMGVEPGFSGQRFQPKSIQRLKALMQHKDAAGLDFRIFMDGGIDLENGRECAELGADVLVGGAFVWKQGNVGQIEADCRKFVQAISVSRQEGI